MRLGSYLGSVRVGLGALPVIGGCGGPPVPVSGAPVAMVAPRTGAAKSTPLEERAAVSPGADAVPSITAVEGFEKIRLRPFWDAPVIGVFRAGQSIPLLYSSPLAGGWGFASCPGGWYTVQPRGYVCLGESSTLSHDDPRALAAAEVLPDRSNGSRFRVGVAIGSPRYLRIPTRAEQRQAEKNLDEHLLHLPPPVEGQGAIDGRPAGVAPTAVFLRWQAAAKRSLMASEELPPGTRIAWAREFDAEGRTWLETPELELIPKDKVRIPKEPDLHGVELGGERRLPLAFAWLGEVPKLVKGADGNMTESGESWPRQAFIPATGNVVKAKGGLYVEASDGSFAKSELVSLIRAQKELPVGVGPKDKWVSVKVTRGYLVAYEGATPVFATAASPGIDGVADREHATLRGTFHVGWKMLSADMSGEDAGTDWRVEEVPHVIYFKDHFALHGAWWHDEFGRPKSHGCVNLAPSDARFLFGWLDPVIPEGWYGVTSYFPGLKGTVIEIRK